MASAMEALHLSPHRTDWYEWIKRLLVLGTERITSIRSGIFWTLSYVLLLALMYLFHSPFRSQLNTRTDWYAQLTKGLQIWLAVVLLCFHVGPHLVESRSSADAAAEGRPPNAAVDVAAEHMLSNDTVATIFFPTFCFSTSLCLLLHKVKRRYGVVVTYGPSFTIVMINSILLASFATLHSTACNEVFASAAATAERWWTLPLLGSPAPPSTWWRISQVACPPPVATKPFACITFLCSLCLAFVGVDYAYKRYMGDGDPTRGILWAEQYPEKACDDHAAASQRSVLFRRWRLQRLRDSNTETARRLGLAESDPRLQEVPPQTVSLLSRAAQARRWYRDTKDADGWQDEHDRLSLVAQKHVAHPTNRPGMVPWYSAFILSTTWQAVARMSLEFLTFDVRVLQHYALPKVFQLHFGASVADMPRLCATDDCTDDAAVTSTTGGSTITSPSHSSAFSPPPIRRQTTAPLSPETGKASTTPGAAEEADIWFDWIADVGDGFNPTYAMARLLARPVLRAPWRRPPSRGTGVSFLPAFGDVTPTETPTVEKRPCVLPRASFVLVGGDLAYPGPNDDTYTTRLFEPYHDAMGSNARLQNLFHAEQQRVVVADAEDADVAHVHLLDAATVSGMATGRAALRAGRATAEEALRSVPLLFAIPGNHDWFDGLTTFRKYILERTWIGGWLMPQRSSFFVLRLPHNWFVLCGDTGNTQDIDAAQRNYFLDVIERYMDVHSCVVLAAHEPGWLLDAMERDDKPRQPELNRVVEVLGTRLRLRLAGDVHHYSRHTPRDASSEAATLVVSGGGGAFLHGARDDPIIAQGTAYMRACAFPDRNTFMNMASRLWGFRVVNWKFDLVVGFLCFALLLSVLPLPMDADVAAADGSGGGGGGADELGAGMGLARLFSLWVGYTTEIMSHVVTRGVISLVPLVIFWACFAAAGADRHAPLLWRLCYGGGWAVAVLFSCCGAMAFVHVQLLYLREHDLLHSVDGEWGSELENQFVFMIDAAVEHVLRYTGGDASVVSRELRRGRDMLCAVLPTGWLRLVLRCLDPFESLGYLSMRVSGGAVAQFAATASRLQVTLYYLYVLFFYWVLITPIVSVLIGTFLLFSVTTFDYMYDGTYSAFQMEEYKHFLRFRLDAATRELHGYVVAVKTPPKVYRLDRGYLWSLRGAGLEEHRPPHLKQHPSRWGPAISDERGRRPPAEILEHFTVHPHRVPQRTKQSFPAVS